MKATRLAYPALLAGILLFLGSCTDQAPLPPKLAQQHAAFGSLVDSLVQTAGLVSCTPQPYDSATQVIGPLGGTLHVGLHTLTVPPGALLVPTAITGVAPPDSVNLVQFQPQGLVFQQPATLTMSYANCDLLGVILPKAVVYVDDSLNILNVLQSIDLMSGTVTAKIPHFSGYAVAW